MERSTKTDRKAVARKFVEKWQREIERGEFAVEGEPTFLSAAVNYLKHGGHARPMHRLIEHFGEKPLRQIDQAEIDAAALALFPNHSPATRNREVYTPVSASMKAGGRRDENYKTKGSRGRELTGWLWPEEAEKLFKAADALDLEFGLLCRFLCYTGLRLKDLPVPFKDRTPAAFRGLCLYPDNEERGARSVGLPPHLVAALATHPRGLERPGKRLPMAQRAAGSKIFSSKAARDAGVILPSARHSMFPVHLRDMDAPLCGFGYQGLVFTGAWKSEQSASRYAHAVVSEEATRASLLPFGEVVENGIENKKA